MTFDYSRAVGFYVECETCGADMDIDTHYGDPAPEPDGWGYDPDYGYTCPDCIARQRCAHCLLEVSDPLDAAPVAGQIGKRNLCDGHIDATLARTGALTTL